LDQDRVAVAEVGKADREQAGAEESTALVACGMRVSRPAAGEAGLEAAAPAEAALAVAPEEVPAAVAEGMAPVEDMVLEVGVVMAPAEVGLGRVVAMVRAAVVVQVEGPEREPVMAAELEMEPAAGPEEERVAVGARALDLAVGALAVAADLAPGEADQEEARADMGLVEAVDLEAADRVDPDSDLVEVALVLVWAAALEAADLVEVVQEERALDLAQEVGDRGLVVAVDLDPAKVADLAAGVRGELAPR
jgi:hypothetical protein